MEYYVGKILQPLISPYHIGILALLLALWQFKRNNMNGAKRCVVFALVFLLLPGIPFFADLPFLYLERKYRPMEVNTQPQCDAIVVLGGTSVRKCYPRMDAEEMGGARLLQAARLYRGKKAKYIIVSGGLPYKSTDGTTRTEADDMQDVLIGMGVPRSAVLREVESRNTVENAIETAKLLKVKNLRSILLVTSAFHMPRSLPLFEAQGLTVHPVPCSYWVTDGLPEVTHFVPSADALHRSSVAIKELAGALFNRLTRKS